MEIYIVLFIIIIFCMILNVNRRKIGRKVFVIIMFAMIALVAMLRSWRVGIDTAQYYRNFTVIANMGWSEAGDLRYEIGYFALCKILSYISSDGQILIIVTSLFIVTSIGRFIYKYSKDVVLSAFLYISLNIYFFHLNGMRQSLAIAVLLWGVDYLVTDKKIRFLIVVYLASLFHSSAFVFSIILLVKDRKYTKKTYIQLMLVTVVGFIFAVPMFKIVTGIMGKYSGYLDSKFGEANYFGALFQFIIGFSIYSLCHYLHISRIKTFENKIDQIVMWSVGIATCCFAMTMRMNIIGRSIQYFWTYALILVPNTISSIKGRARLRTKCIICVGTFLYWLIIGTLRPHWLGGIPYSAFWQS